MDGDEVANAEGSSQPGAQMKSPRMFRGLYLRSGSRVCGPGLAAATAARHHTQAEQADTHQAERGRLRNREALQLTGAFDRMRRILRREGELEGRIQDEVGKIAFPVRVDPAQSVG